MKIFKILLIFIAIAVFVLIMMLPSFNGGKGVFGNVKSKMTLEYCQNFAEANYHVADFIKTKEGNVNSFIQNFETPNKDVTDIVRSMRFNNVEEVTYENFDEKVLDCFNS